MNPRVIFDVSHVGYQSGYFPAFGLIFLAIGLVLISVNRSRAKAGLPPISSRSGRPAKWFPYFILIFSSVWISLAFSLTYFPYRDLRSAHERGDCRIVQGQILNFRPGGEERGQTEESFDVAGVHFAYSPYTANAGFNQSVVKGGPLKPGAQVRIHEFGGQIARLEILP
jgi:hypothetical protein